MTMNGMGGWDDLVLRLSFRSGCFMFFGLSCNNKRYPVRRGRCLFGVGTYS